MKYLLDSHVLLWFCNGDAKLSKAARRIMEDPANAPVISIASVFELSAKAARKSLELDCRVSEFAHTFVTLNHGELLPILPVHCARVEELPTYHLDPFDRMLVAQAAIESLPLVTGDAHLARYGIELIW